MHRAKFGSDFSWLKEHVLKIFDFAILCTVFFQHWVISATLI